MTNMTGFTNLTSFDRVVSAVNTSTGGIASFLILLCLFIILFVSLLRNNPPQESILASSAATTVVALLLWSANLTDLIYVTGFGVVFAVSAIVLAMNR